MAIQPPQKTIEPAPVVTGPRSWTARSAVPARLGTRPVRVRIGQALVALAAFSAMAAALSDITTVAQAPAATTVVETWRLCGFALFAGLFALLAARPTGYRGLWELTIANKFALTALAITYAAHGHIPGTSQVMLWDGSLTVVLLAAYAACQPWRRPAPPER